VSPVDPVRDDGELLIAWRGGDKVAGSELVRRRMPEMIRFFRNKVAAEADIADLVNQTFLGCVGGKDEFRGETSFRRFVYAIANNVLFAYIRRRSKHVREQLDFATVCVSDVAPQSASSIVTDRRETQALVAALREIPIEDQVVVELMYFEGLSGAQIGEALDLPEGTVRGRLRRGLERLRTRVHAVLDAGPSSTPPDEDELLRWAEHVQRQLGSSRRRAGTDHG
jgi:RNA polymerase sigma factor (sigma-70 family)